MRRFLFVISVMVFRPAAYALEWKVTDVILRPDDNGTMPVARYEFWNSTRSEVTITNILASCDCTTVEISKKRYASGDRGVLVARFDPTGRSGIVTRTITVTTDEATEPQILQLTAKLPESLTFSPRELVWSAGSMPIAKTIDILVNDPAGVELVDGWANNPDFKVDFKIVSDRKHYRITVTPPRGARAQQVVVALRSNGSVPSGTSLSFYCRVK